MENTYRGLSEAVINHTIEVNRQMYDLGLKMFKDYSEFGQKAFQLVPGLEAWQQMMPFLNKK